MRKRFTAEVEAEIIRLYKTPNPDGTWNGAKSIARVFKVSPQTIYNILERNSVPTRDAKESHSGGKRCKPIVNLPPDQDAPPCKCGCGGAVDWNRRKNRWNMYIIGHYRQGALYKSADWLNDQYTNRKRTLDSIADECGVNRGTIIKFMRKFSIPIRSQAESLALSGAVRGERNPAWKGGVAQWDYSHDWKAICKQIKDRDQWTCQKCGEKRQRWGIHLHVHHIDGNKLNNLPDNLISLCAKCHRETHSGAPQPSQAAASAVFLRPQ